MFDQQNLRYLDLAFNNFKTVYQNLWLCLQSLETLIITGNPVVVIAPQAFLPLNNLHRLYLDLHMLAKFYLAILNSLKYLKDIKLVAEEVTKFTEIS